MTLACATAGCGKSPSERHILFAPGRTPAWKIDGDYKMDDGNLTLGGATPVRFRAAELAGDHFLFRLDYRASVGGPAQVAGKGPFYPDPQSGAVMQSTSGSREAPGITFEFRNLFSSGSAGMGFSEAAKAADQWHRAVFRGDRNPTTGNLEIVGWVGSAAASEADLMQTRPTFQSVCDSRRFGDIAINVPADSQLIIREAVLDGDVADGSNLRLLLVLILAGIIALIAAGAAIWHGRRRLRSARETGGRIGDGSSFVERMS